VAAVGTSQLTANLSLSVVAMLGNTLVHCQH
jgi:hypothetical protein